MYVFKMLMGLNGVVWATPFAEVVSVSVASVLYMKFRRELKEEEQAEI